MNLLQLTKEEGEINSEIQTAGQLVNDVSKKLQNAVALSSVNKQNVIAVSMMLWMQLEKEQELPKKT